MVENVVKYQRWSHKYSGAVPKQVMAMTIEPKLLATPEDHWTDLPVRVPGFRAWAELTIVPASSSVREYGLRHVSFDQCIDDVLSYRSI
jgi:hypothetical protein